MKKRPQSAIRNPPFHDLVMERETIEIEGGRSLHSYTFREATDLDRLMAMIETGEVGVIGPFLDQHPDLDLSARAEPPLHTAARCGHIEAISELTSRGAPLEDHDQRHNASPLEWAAYFGQAEAARELRQQGARVTDRALHVAREGANGRSSEADPERHRETLLVLEGPR